MTTDLFDPADTGELRFAPGVAEAARPDRLERTRVMRPYDMQPPALRLYVTDEHPQLRVPETIGVVDGFQPPLPGDPPAPQPPTPPPVPIPGPPIWSEPSGWHPVVEPVRAYRSVPYVKPEGWVRTVRHRPVQPTPVWLLVLVGVGSGVVGAAILWALLWAVAR